MNVKKSSMRQSLACILVFLLSAISSQAFTSPLSLKQQHVRFNSLEYPISSALHSWSIQAPSWSMEAPTFPNMDTSFGSGNSWCSEVKNPISHTTSYDDAPLEYTFVSAGSDWPSMGDTVPASEERVRSRRRPLRAIRRAATRAFRGRIGRR